MTVRQVRGIKSYKLTNNASKRCGGEQKADIPSRAGWWARTKNHVQLPGRAPTTAFVCDPSKKIYFMYLPAQRGYLA